MGTIGLPCTRPDASEMVTCQVNLGPNLFDLVYGFFKLSVFAFSTEKPGGGLQRTRVSLRAEGVSAEDGEPLSPAPLRGWWPCPVLAGWAARLRTRPPVSALGLPSWGCTGHTGPFACFSGRFEDKRDESTWNHVAIVRTSVTNIVSEKQRPWLR